MIIAANYFRVKNPVTELFWERHFVKGGSLFYSAFVLTLIGGFYRL